LKIVQTKNRYGREGDETLNVEIEISQVV
jgi:hypothetical protein